MKSFLATAALGLLAFTGANAFSVRSDNIRISVEKVAPKEPQLDLCPTCVTFMDNAIEELVEIIANGGVIGSCGALCSLLPNELEATICDLLCDYVGIEEFIKLLDDVDPDPIWICEELNVCPINDNAAANITYAGVQPQRGHKGEKFLFTLNYDIINPIGTGELDILIIPPDAEPFGDGNLLVNVPAGSYSAQFELQAKPNEQEPFDAGNYTTVFQICEGSCGSTHSHSFTLATALVNFTLVN